MATTEVEEELVVCDDIMQAIARDLNCLTDENRSVRKQSLESISRQTVGVKPTLGSLTIHELLLKLYKPLLRCFSDHVEKCRELSISMIMEFWKLDEEAEATLPYLIPTLVQRIGMQELNEPSEEIRLTLVLFLRTIIDRCEDRVAPYLDDIIRILTQTIIDPYPEVKKESCHCASKVSFVLRQYFHMQSETLINPLLLSLTHQHAKVRVACVLTIGDVVQNGNNKSIDDVVHHLAQRLFDRSPQVRLAVTQVAGMWLVELPDRYSYFWRLIPLVLTSVSDDVAEVRKLAEEMWLRAGELYMKENDEELKDQLDFSADPPAHYPPNVQRPNLGCRVLVHRHFTHILPGLLNDLDDWVMETRLKAAQLLYWLLLNGEATLTQQLSRVLIGMCQASADNDVEVVHSVSKAAEIIGYFVKPDVYSHLILDTIRGGPTSANLNVLAALIRGTEASKLEVVVEEICDVISAPDICRDSRPKYQFQLLNCVRSVVQVSKYASQDVSLQLFQTLLTVYALATEEEVRNMAHSIMVDLCEAQGLRHPHDLYRKHLGDILDSLVETQNSWTSHSPERYILEAILCCAGPALGEHLDVLIPMLKANLHPDKDPQTRLKFYTALSNLMLKLNDGLDSAEKFDDFIIVVVEDLIIPNLVWHAGKTASAIRTAAISCLWALIEGGRMTTEKANKLLPCLESLVTQLVSLMEDDSRTTRLVACQVLQSVFEMGGCHLEQHRLYNLYPELMKRMDDASDEIRFVTTRLFRAYFKSFKGQYEVSMYRAHLEDIFNGLLVHLDDPDPKLQQAVFELLRDVAALEPSSLRQKVEEVKHKHRTSMFCDQLLERIDALSLT